VPLKACMMNFINNKDKVGSAIILLFSLVYLNASFDIPINQVLRIEVFTARTLPIYLSTMAIVVCLIQMFIPSSGAADDSIKDAIAGFQWKPCFLLTGLMLIYSLTFKFVGFAIGTFLFLFIGFAILKEKRYLLSATIAGGVSIFMWLILTQMFDIYLDSGDLYRLLAEG
jgi:putative tricarboxylic transport membrane protein